MVQALALADSTLAILEDIRANAECVFADLFAAVATLCSDIHVELVKSRLCKRQLARLLATTYLQKRLKRILESPFLFHLLIASVDN